MDHCIDQDNSVLFPSEWTHEQQCNARSKITVGGGACYTEVVRFVPTFLTENGFCLESPAQVAGPLGKRASGASDVRRVVSPEARTFSWTHIWIEGTRRPPAVSRLEAKRLRTLRSKKTKDRRPICLKCPEIQLVFTGLKTGSSPGALGCAFCARKLRLVKLLRMLRVTNPSRKRSLRRSVTV